MPYNNFMYQMSEWELYSEKIGIDKFILDFDASSPTYLNYWAYSVMENKFNGDCLVFLEGIFINFLMSLFDLPLPEGIDEDCDFEMCDDYDYSLHENFKKLSIVCRKYCEKLVKKVKSDLKDCAFIYPNENKNETIFDNIKGYIITLECDTYEVTIRRYRNVIGQDIVTFVLNTIFESILKEDFDNVNVNIIKNSIRQNKDLNNIFGKYLA